MEGNFNTKNLKATLSIPTPKGKEVNTYFKKQMKNMPLKETHILNEKEESLKKKIFKLDKMETLVHTDEFLSKKFAELKEDADEWYGYHWNETILNILFNDYVLNSPKYLQKYKNTHAKHKTRRGEEGIAELQKDIDKEKEVKSGTEKRKQDLLKKHEINKNDDDNDKKELDELFNFFDKDVNIPFEKRSKNDTYFVDVRRNKLVEPVPYSASSDEKREIITKNSGKPDIKQISWFDAVSKGVKGVPKEVPDGSFEEIKKEMELKYKPQGGISQIPALGETNGASNSGAYTSALDADKSKEVVDKTYQNETTTSASSGQYSTASAWSKTGKPAANKPAWHGGKVIAESVINGDLSYMTDPAPFKRYIIKNQINDLLNESVNEGESFKDYSARMLEKLQQYASEEPSLNNDKDFQELLDMYKKQSESGVYSPPPSRGTEPKQVVKKTGNSTSQWKKPELPMKEHHLSSKEEKIEFILNNGTDSKYDIDTLNSMNDEEIDSIYLSIENEIGINEESIYEGESFKDYSAKMLQKLQQYASENPRLNNDSEFKELVNMYKKQAESGMNILPSSKSTPPKQVVKKVGNTTSQWKKPELPMKENDVNEQPDFEEMLKTDLKHTGRKVNGNESTAELKAKDGLFKDGWNLDENEKLAVNKLLEFGKNILNGISDPNENTIANFANENGISVQSLKDKAKFYASNAQLFPNGKEVKMVMNGLVNAIDGLNLNEEATSKKQQKFMGMVYAAKKGKLKNPSPEVEKAAESMSTKDAKDFASTKHKGLPEKKKEKVDEDSSFETKEDLKQLAIDANNSRNKTIVNKAGNELSNISNNINDIPLKLKSILNKYNITNSDDITNIIDIAGTIKGNIYENNSKENTNTIEVIKNFNSSEDNIGYRNEFVKVKNKIKNKVGTIKEKSQLKSWFDKNMPELSKYVNTLWGNWDLEPTNK